MARQGSAFRDVLYAVLLVGGLIAAIWVWSGVWPPLVVIESGSMRHPHEPAPYGRIGTIDPGDMVFVKQLDLTANGGRGDVELYGDPAGDDRFGMTGDVIVFYKNGLTVRGDGQPETPIIHRAMAWVEVDKEEGRNATFRVLWKGQMIPFDEKGIFIEELNFRGYKPPHKGYITKGDNPDSNAAPDQLGLGAAPTLPEWIQGKARGEIPWFGLVKLAIGQDLKNAPSASEKDSRFGIRVGNVYAFGDQWVMLVSSVLAIVLVPLAWDVWRRARDRRRAEEEAFETMRPRLLPRPIVKPLPPPGPADGPMHPAWARLGTPEGRRIARFEIVQPPTGGGGAS